MSTQEAQRSGKVVFEIEHLSVKFGDNAPIINDFSALVMRGDRIGLVGDNGVGKTTLIKAILGEIEHGGTVKTGTQLEIAYFDQLRNVLDLENQLKITFRRFRSCRCEWPTSSYLQLSARLPVLARTCPYAS